MKKMQVGVKGMTIQAEIVDEDGAPVALDGTVIFHFEGPDAVDIEVTGSIEDAPGGVAAYLLADGDGVGEIVGKWKYQVELDLTSGWTGKTEVKRFEAVANLS